MKNRLRGQNTYFNLDKIVQNENYRMLCFYSDLPYLSLTDTVITNITQGSQAIYSKCTPFNTLKIIRNKEPRKNTPCHSERVHFFSDHTLGGQYCQICTVHAVECSQGYT